MSENIIEQHLKALSLHRINETYKIEAENAAKAISVIRIICRDFLRLEIHK